MVWGVLGLFGVFPRTGAQEEYRRDSEAVVA